MCTYKGNAGHLMQHWTLCELLVTASRHTSGTSGLSFIDAHAMAPLANERQVNDALFTHVESCLPNRCESAYESAWHHLAPSGGYPNSAAFVEKVWEGDFSLLLCEINPTTNAKLEPWLQRVNNLERCKTAELFQGDWRRRIEKGLPSPSATGLADGSLTLISFDPYMYSRHQVAKKRKGNLYPEDIKLAMRATDSLESGMLIQLSTYSANGDNAQGAVISSVDSVMGPKGFALCGKMKVHGNMMSLVYARNVSWAAELTELPGRFEKWLAAVKQGVQLALIH